MQFEEPVNSTANGVEASTDEKKSDELTRKGVELAEPERFVDKVITAGRVVGEGNKGIVLKVATDEVGGAEEGLGGKQFDEDNQAVKLLKVYQDGVGKREYELQNKVASLVNNSENELCAEIPQAYHYRDTSLTQDQRETLKKRAGKSFKNNRVELFMMDYIDGEELYQRLMKEVVWRSRDNVNREEVNTLSEQELTKEAERAVGFQAKSFNSDGLSHRSQNEFREFVIQMYDFLKKKQVKVKKEVTKQIENTINIFKENDLQHNDLHERNIMIQGPLFSNGEGANNNDDTQIYIIDFGEMGERKENDSSGMRDDVVLNRLRKNFTDHKSAMETQEDDLIQLNDRFGGRGSYEKTKQKIEDILNAEGKYINKERQLAKILKDQNTDKEQMKIYFSALYDVIYSKPEHKDLVVDFIKKQEKKSKSTWKKNLLSDIKSLFRSVSEK